MLPRDLVAAQAEMFLVSGDMNSNLYTSSRAMHSAIIGLLQVSTMLTSGMVLRDHGYAYILDVWQTMVLLPCQVQAPVLL